MLETAVVGWHRDHGFGVVFFDSGRRRGDVVGGVAEWEKVDVHLSRKAFR